MSTDLPERIWIDWEEREFHLAPLAGYNEYVRADSVVSPGLISRDEAVALAKGWEDRDDVNPARWIASALASLPAQVSPTPDVEAAAEEIVDGFAVCENEKNRPAIVTEISAIITRHCSTPTRFADAVQVVEKLRDEWQRRRKTEYHGDPHSPSVDYLCFADYVKAANEIIAALKALPQPAAETKTTQAKIPLR